MKSYDCIRLYSKQELEKMYEWWRSYYAKKHMKTSKPLFTFSEIQSELYRLQNIEVLVHSL